MCFERVASFGRLILFDRRGTGLSDRIGAELPTLDQRMDDIIAVLDAVGSSRAALVGLAAASMLTATFAATYPERTQALVLYEPHARGSYATDYPWTPPWSRHPGTGRPLTRLGLLTYARELLAQIAPSRADDAALIQWLATSPAPQRTPASCGGAGGHGLPDRCPPCAARCAGADVLQRTAALAEESRWIAGQIPGARLVSLPGPDHMLISGNTDAAVDEIERFLTGTVQTAPHSTGAGHRAVHRLG